MFLNFLGCRVKGLVRYFVYVGEYWRDNWMGDIGVF